MPSPNAGASRKITLFPLIAATYLMVAGGPYGLEDIVSKSGYAGALMILLVTPLIWSLPTSLMVSELAAAVPEEGGYYVWVTRGLGRFWGYQEAWLSLAASVFDMAIYPTLFVAYLGHFVPALTAGWRGTGIAVAMIAACALWNLAGAKAVGVSSFVMCVVLLGPFAALAGYAAFRHSAGGGASIPLRSVDVLGGILVAMWNYMGWDNASTVAEEVDRPQRTYPLAMVGTVLLVTLTYVLPIGAVALTGLDANRWSTGGWADVARAVFHNGMAGQVVAVAITIGGMVAALGTFNALTMSYSRVPAVLAEDGYLPKIFTRMHPRTGVPTVAIAACSVVWALGLGLTFVKLVLIDVLLTGLYILLEFAALVALRIREPRLPRPYRVPGGLAGAVGIAVLPAALLVLTAVRNRAESFGPVNGLVFGALLAGGGVVAYFLGEHFRRHDHR